MKYRIIEQRDYNGKRHYELEVFVKSLFGSWKWKPVLKDICSPMGHSFRVIRTFELKDDVHKFIDSMAPAVRNVIEEGEVDWKIQ